MGDRWFGTGRGVGDDTAAATRAALADAVVGPGPSLVVTLTTVDRDAVALHAAVAEE